MASERRSRWSPRTQDQSQPRPGEAESDPWLRHPDPADTKRSSRSSGSCVKRLAFQPVSFAQVARCSSPDTTKKDLRSKLPWRRAHLNWVRSVAIYLAQDLQFEVLATKTS